MAIHPKYFRPAGINVSSALARRGILACPHYFGSGNDKEHPERRAHSACMKCLGLQLTKIDSLVLLAVRQGPIASGVEASSYSPALS